MLWFLNIPVFVMKIIPLQSFTKEKIIMSYYLYTTIELVHINAQTKSELPLWGEYESGELGDPKNLPAT